MSLHFKDGMEYWKVHDDANATLAVHGPPEERWTFLLDDDVVAALAEFWNHYHPVEPKQNLLDHQAAARDDAMKVRDQALGMVEHLIGMGRVAPHAYERNPDA